MDPGFHTPGHRLFSEPGIDHYFAPGRFGFQPRQPGQLALAESLPGKAHRLLTTLDYRYPSCCPSCGHGYSPSAAAAAFAASIAACSANCAAA